MKVKLLCEIAAEGAGGGPVLMLPPPPPQPAHIKTSIVAAVRASHFGGLARPAVIASSASMRKVPRSRPTQRKLKRNRREAGRAGIESGTGGVKATAVVATLIVAVIAEGPVKPQAPVLPLPFPPAV